MRVSPENFVKVGVMAVVFIALAKMASQRFGITGLAGILP